MTDFRQVGLSNPRTLLLWGDADATLPPEQAPKVQAALGDNVQFELIGNAGHALHVERADQVNAQLAAFLNADRYTQ
jgi:pimeloyl-ACP methyl ester carboxylesterase